MIDKDRFQSVITNLKTSGNYRVFNDILRERGEYPQAIYYVPYNIKNIVNWCSNDYLGMGVLAEFESLVRLEIGFRLSAFLSLLLISKKPPSSSNKIILNQCIPQFLMPLFAKFILTLIFIEVQAS